VELHQQLDLFEQPAPAPAPPGTLLGNLGVPFHTAFADAALKATGATGVGGHIGVLFEPNDRFSFGVRYLSRIKLNYTGTATFTPVATGIVLPAGNPFGVPAGTKLDAVVASSFATGGPLANGNVSTTITMPDQIVAGIAAKVTRDTRVFADYFWENWKLLDALTLTFSNPATPTKSLVQNDRATSGVRLGGEWTGNDRVTVRGGWLYHSAAAPAETVTPLLPEGSRNEFTGGLGFSLNQQLRADMAYQYIRQQDRRGRVREALSGALPTVNLNSGLYTFHANLVALTLTVRF
jgi:long-chain fatty acid transport protein